MIVLENKTGENKGKYTVWTHSLMYDKGYVVVGVYYTNCMFYNGAYEFDGRKYDIDITGGSDRPFCFAVAYNFSDYETAKQYADKGIKAYNPTFEHSDATIYYQKIEDVKFGYLMEDGKRIVNDEEIRNTAFYVENPF